MNTTADENHPDLRYAEYVLGVLDADERAQVEQEIQSDAHAASVVALWERHLVSLNEDVEPVTPGPYVWARIVDALGLSTTVAASTRAAPSQSPHAAPPRREPSPGWWDSLKLWRWIGVGASVATAVCLVLIFQLQPSTTPSAVTPPAATAQAGNYMTVKIAQDNGIAAWTATLDIDRARMVIVPASPAALATNRSDELWLLPPGEKPISLGVIGHDKPTALDVPQALLAKLSDKALLAVSIEPVGGSTTGQPTGPVVAKGQFSGI